VDNFGTTGERPTHPELLDHLATRFMADGWSIKQLVRAIVQSRTYQLSTRATVAAAEKDPDNRWYSHANRRRLDAEEIRDAILWTSGRLVLTVGGPNFGPTVESAAPSSEYGFVFTDTRRSVYTPAFRNRRLELFEAFDFGDINASTGQRGVSTVAPQALFLMNHPFVIEQAKFAAQRTLGMTGVDDAARIERAYRATLGRGPTDRERALAREFLAGERDAAPDENGRIGRWAQFHQSLFACVDFRYLD
jgi:hypothetical protein